MSKVAKKKDLVELRKLIQDWGDAKDRAARRQVYNMTALLFRALGKIGSDEFKMMLSNRNKWYGKKIPKKKKDQLKPQVEEIKNEAVDLIMHEWNKGGEDANIDK